MVSTVKLNCMEPIAPYSSTTLTGTVCLPSEASAPRIRRVPIPLPYENCMLDSRLSMKMVTS